MSSNLSPEDWLTRDPSPSGGEFREQKQLLQETEWDYLLLLDDFRFDLFSAIYDDHLDITAEPEPVWSAGSHTIHWLSEAWPDEYPEITYVSGHALVNSDGVPGLYPARQEANENGVNGDYIPAAHFSDIIDVWDFGYMETVETVPPWSINEVLRGESPHADQPKPPVIAHYVQPHFPWMRGHMVAEEHDLPVNDDYRRDWTPEPTGGIGPQFRRGWVREQLGMDGVKKAYQDNARIALEGVADILPDLRGTVVITSDHGERFEEGVTHPPGSDHHELRVVPWVKLDK